ncbi:MAG: prephenate dehydrogenase [Termitinemataceae bacterium]|nr:MAG: prephenate dehydrogenase [Termitinemataceae bacterium]
MQNITYGFVGLGLMGGSFAKAIREKILSLPNARGRILAVDKNVRSLRQSIDEKIIDTAYNMNDCCAMLSLCDFVFVCLYPKTALDFLITFKQHFKSGSIVTDISGVKNQFAGNIKQFLRTDVDFICAHPMAGSEKEGLQHSRFDLFEGRNYILMPLPSNKEENLIFFKRLVFKIGFKHITESTPEDHDKKIAFTSQLCHVIASALVDSACDTSITNFGGGSFEDLTRIAMINAPLWSELFLENKNELLNQIANFEASLDKIKKHIENNDYDKLCAALQDVRKKRIAMSRGT